MAGEAGTEVNAMWNRDVADQRTSPTAAFRCGSFTAASSFAGGERRSPPAQLGCNVGEHRLKDACAVFDAQLIRDGQQQGVRCGDRLVG